MHCAIHGCFSSHLRGYWFLGGFYDRRGFPKAELLEINHTPLWVSSHWHASTDIGFENTTGSISTQWLSPNIDSVHTTARILNHIQPHLNHFEPHIYPVSPQNFPWMAPDKSITFMLLYRHFLVVVSYRILHSALTSHFFCAVGPSNSSLRTRLGKNCSAWPRAQSTIQKYGVIPKWSNTRSGQTIIIH